MVRAFVCPHRLRRRQPSAGADPPFVFNRWMKLVVVKMPVPIVPFSDPITCSSRHAIEPSLGQLWSEPALIESTVCAHTLLLSSELCHVALPKGIGFGANLFGLVLGLRKWVIICTSCPKKLVNRVARGEHCYSPREPCAGRQADVALAYPWRVRARTAEPLAVA